MKLGVRNIRAVPSAAGSVASVAVAGAAAASVFVASAVGSASAFLDFFPLRRALNLALRVSNAFGAIVERIVSCYTGMLKLSKQIDR